MAILKKSQIVAASKSLFPILKWLPNYTVNFLQCDIIAGVTIGLMVVPQALAYASVAGL
jgi:sodium-independent sulfate anion transporter 11